MTIANVLFGFSTPAAAEQWLPRMLVLEPLQALLKLAPLLALLLLPAAALLLLAWAAQYAWLGYRRFKRIDTEIWDALPYPVAVRDTQLRLVTCNLAYARASQRLRRALYRLDVTEAIQRLRFSGLDSAQLSEWYTQVIESRRAAVSTRTAMRNSATISLRHWASPWIDASGHSRGVVTGWLETADSPHDPAHTQRTSPQSEASLNDRAVFLASISHEIHTPMNAVIGLIEVTLLNTSLSAPERQQLDTALASARSLLSLVGDMLRLSKLEANAFDLHPAVASVHAVTSEVVALYKPIAAEKDVLLGVNITPSVAPHHVVDPVRLKQILSNLISNAIRYTDHGNVTVTVSAARPVNGRQLVQICIADSGAGIPGDALRTLFDPYSQVSAPDAQIGTGLGLSICKRLIDSMAGRLRLFSRPGQGTRVYVRLPLPVASAPSPTTRPSMSGRSDEQIPILVVDDQAANRLLLQRQLETLGHRVVCVDNGKQALEVTEQQVFKFVICDCAMPQMSGLEFVCALNERAHGHLALPVLGYTAGVSPEEIQKLLKAGMKTVLLAPLSLSELQQALHAHVPADSHER